MSDEAQVERRGPGRPRKVEAKPEGQAVPNKFKMKAKPNWETIDPAALDSTDRFHIPPEDIPEGMSLQWITDTVNGQPEAQLRSQFEKTGWTPVHQSDFDGIYDGRFMKRGAEGEINLGGQVLMARPKEITDMAKLRERRKAIEQVAIKEQALHGGDLPGVSLDSQHKTAIASNRISKSYERIEVPSDLPPQE